MASMPTAPIPAKPSRNTQSSTDGPRTLNSVSRSLSLVGRMPAGGVPFKRRLLNVPAMTLIAGSSYGRQTCTRAPSSCRGHLENTFGVVVGVGKLSRFTLSHGKHCGILEKIGHPELRHAGLARTGH